MSSDPLKYAMMTVMMGVSSDIKSFLEKQDFRLLILACVLFTIYKYGSELKQAIPDFEKNFYNTVTIKCSYGSNLSIKKEKNYVHNDVIIKSILNQKIDDNIECKDKEIVNRYTKKCDGHTLTLDYEKNRDIMMINGGTNFSAKYEGGVIHVEIITVENKEEAVNEDGKAFTKRSYDVTVLLKTAMSYDILKKYITEKRDGYLEMIYSDKLKQSLYEPLDAKSTNVAVVHQKVEIDYKKTFDDLYIPNKKQIVKQIDDFKNKEGIYKKTGVANKLGILLHGKPGTGKTSFIKALANRHNLSVIVVNLECIKDKQQLFHLFGDKSIYVRSGRADKSEILSMKRRLYVFEEIDSAGDIVMDRDKKAEKDERIQQSLLKANDSKYKNMNSSPINLQDMLRLLDGLNELDGCIYVATTNKIDFLDPALIRDGRFNIKIELNEIKKEELFLMLKDYYPEEDVDELEEIANYMGGKYSPAELEANMMNLDFESFREKYNVEEDDGSGVGLEVDPILDFPISNC